MNYFKYFLIFMIYIIYPFYSLQQNYGITKLMYFYNYYMTLFVLSRWFNFQRK